jgi:hypothetical protein
VGQRFRSTLVLGCSVLCCMAHGQDLLETSHAKPNVQFYSPSKPSSADQNSNAIREYLTGTARAYVESEGRVFYLTDGWRPATKTVNHANYGAIDFRSNDPGMDSGKIHEEAAGLSAKYGADTWVIVEEGYQSPNEAGMPLFIMPPVRTLTYFVNGKATKVQLDEFKATHTHVQAARTQTPAQFVSKHGLHPTNGDVNVEKTLLEDGYGAGIRLGMGLPPNSMLNPLNNPQLAPIVHSFGNLFGQGPLIGLTGIGWGPVISLQAGDLGGFHLSFSTSSGSFGP